MDKKEASSVAEKEFHRFVDGGWAYKWLKRFDNAGLEGLKNRHRSGRPPKNQEELGERRGVRIPRRRRPLHPTIHMGRSIGPSDRDRWRSSRRTRRRLVVTRSQSIGFLRGGCNELRFVDARRSPWRREPVHRRSRRGHLSTVGARRQPNHLHYGSERSGVALPKTHRRRPEGNAASISD